MCVVMSVWFSTWLCMYMLCSYMCLFSHDSWAYRMDKQAEAVLELLSVHNVQRVAVLAHSMGGVGNPLPQTRTPHLSPTTHSHHTSFLKQ